MVPVSLLDPLVISASFVPRTSLRRGGGHGLELWDIIKGKRCRCST